MKKKLWLQITQDKYALPVVVADSVSELSRKTGADISNIYKSFKRKRNTNTYPKWEVVEVDIDD